MPALDAARSIPPAVERLSLGCSETSDVTIRTAAWFCAIQMILSSRSDIQFLGHQNYHSANRRASDISESAYCRPVEVLSVRASNILSTVVISRAVTRSQ